MSLRVETEMITWEGAAGNDELAGKEGDISLVSGDGND